MRGNKIDIDVKIDDEPILKGKKINWKSLEESMEMVRKKYK